MIADVNYPELLKVKIVQILKQIGTELWKMSAFGKKYHLMNVSESVSQQCSIMF